MSAVKALAKHFDQICDSQGVYLRYRIGMVYPLLEGYIGPKNARGVIRYMPPNTGPLRGNMFQKFYLPPQDVQLGSLQPYEPGTGEFFVLEAKYHVPESVRNAPYGELLLAVAFHAQRKSTKPIVRFGRFREKKPFTFNTEERQHMIPLRIYRIEKDKFNPIYIRVERESEIKYSVLDLEWKDNIVTVILLPMEKSDVPEFLAI